MKKLIFIFFLSQFSMNAQDTIALKSKVVNAVKILEVNTETIKYKRIDNPDGPTYSVYKSEVDFVKYSNGIKENIDSLFKAENKGRPEVKVATPSNNALYASQDMTNKGIRDAKIYYKHPGGSIGTGAASLAFGIFGLIPAIICSAIPPKISNLNYPSEEMWKNNDYRRAYRSKAKKIKQKRVWLGFGIGFVGSIILVQLIAP
jgi:hypothetical protein